MSVLRRVGILDTALCAVQRFADAHSLDLLYRANAALYEWLYDQPPPGGGAQVVYGHGHDGLAAGFTGGIAIPRNCIYSAGYGAGDQWMWQATIPAGGGGGAPGAWRAADYDNPSSLPGPADTLSRSSQLLYHFPCYVDTDLDTVTYAGLYADAWVALYIVEAASDLDLRLTNVTTAAVSAVSTFTYCPTILWVHLGEIPVSANVRNDFLLEYRNGGLLESDLTVNTYGFLLSEVYLGGGPGVNPAIYPLTQPTQTGKRA